MNDQLPTSEYITTIPPPYTHTSTSSFTIVQFDIHAIINSYFSLSFHFLSHCYISSAITRCIHYINIYSLLADISIPSGYLAHIDAFNQIINTTERKNKK